MKILHLGKYYPPVFGGIESVTKDIAESFSKKGDDVSVLCFDKKSGHSKLNGVNIFRCKSFLFNSQPLSISYIYNYFKLASEAKILHVHLPNFLALFCVLFFSRNKKIFLHWHSDVLGFYFLGSFLRIFEVLLAKKAEAIIFTSPNYINGSYISNYVKDKFEILPISIEVKETAEKLPPQKNLKILFVGRLVAYKGVKVLLKSLQLVKNFKIELNIIGEGSEKRKKRLKKMADNTGHEINFLGRVEETELKKHYLSSDVFILPSIYRSEAFGVVVLEAFSYGLPCITSNLKNSGLSWINKDKKTGFKFQTNDPYDLAEKIVKFSKLTKMERLEMQNNCIKEIQKKYSHQKMANSLSIIYNNY